MGFARYFLLLTFSFLAMAGRALADDAAGETAAVPEPSAMLIGGLCGILFLFWRSK